MSDRLQQVLSRANSGDQQAAAELWNTVTPGMRAFAHSLLRNESAADDVVQSVMCRLVAMNQETLRSIVDVRAYLFKAVRHAAVTALRAQHRRKRAESAWAYSGVQCDNTSESSQEQHVQLRRLVAQLPRQLREVVILKHAAGLTFDQMVVATGLPRGTLTTRYQSALASLRQQLSISTKVSEAHHA